MLLTGCLSSSAVVDFQPVNLADIPAETLENLRAGLVLLPQNAGDSFPDFLVTLKDNGPLQLAEGKAEESRWSSPETLRIFSNQIGDQYTIGSVGDPPRYFAYRIVDDEYQIVTALFDLDLLESGKSSAHISNILQTLSEGQSAFHAGIEIKPMIIVYSSYVQEEKSGPSDQKKPENALQLMDELRKLADEEVEIARQNICKKAIELCNRGCIQRDNGIWIYNTTDGQNWYTSRGRLLEGDDVPDFSCPIR